jgi:hypothetical protein
MELTIKWKGKGKSTNMILSSNSISLMVLLTEEKAKLKMVTRDLKEALDGVELIIVCTQALSHERVANEIADFIKTNPIPIVLNPGKTSSTIENVPLVVNLIGTQVALLELFILLTCFVSTAWKEFLRLLNGLH